MYSTVKSLYSYVSIFLTGVRMGVRVRLVLVLVNGIRRNNTQEKRHIPVLYSRTEALFVCVVGWTLCRMFGLSSFKEGNSVTYIFAYKNHSSLNLHYITIITLLKYVVIAVSINFHSKHFDMSSVYLSCLSFPLAWTHTKRGKVEVICCAHR